MGFHQRAGRRALSEVWDGLTIAVALDSALAAVRLLTHLFRVDPHVPGCRWWTGAFVFASMWLQEDASVAVCAFLALQAAPALWWFGKRARAIDAAPGADTAQPRPCKRNAFERERLERFGAVAAEGARARLAK